uniref:Uncharacterized protein n=1 Tax=Salix viminalis TaxID=40686 RepID=A0A6N2M3F8_SALVM
MLETDPITEQANPETELAWDRCSPEDLPRDALQTTPRTKPVVQVLEQINAELENLSVGAGRTQVEEEEEEEDVVNNSGRLVQPDAGGSSSGGLKRIPSMTRGFPFPISSSKPVGRAVEANRNVIWSWLMDDEISTIGIYGMGGIGKTTMLQHIHDELLRRPNISHHVYWVTVPQDFSIYRLQNLIARHLDLDLSSEYDILPRAAKLSEELMKKQEWILILDDLWESFELSAVGIPVPLKGCKVIFTTRSVVICHRMDSQVITEVRPLSEREAWTLFMEKLGHGITLSPEMERIAIHIARECAGLPLGIITMAGSLRGVDDQDEWRRTLNILKELKSGDMEDEVFRMLRFSYDRLDDFKLQQCILYCALFPEDYIIKREELVFYLIDEGIIQKMRSREAAYVEGHEMLDRLENAGLLQRIDGGRAVKMHDMVRDMAKEQRRKGIEMAGSNIDRFWNHVEQTNDGERGHGVAICGRVPKVVQKAAFVSLHGGNSTHKTMVQRRKRIEMAPLKSGWTGAISTYAKEKNNVDMAQQREPLLKGEFEQANDLTEARIELPHDTPDNQDELKKLKGSKSRDMVDDFKSKLTGAVSASAREQNNVEMAQQQEPLLTGEFERANDLTAAGIERPPDTPDDQDELKKLKGLKSRDMVDDFKSGLTGAVSASAREQNNVEMAQQQEPLLTGEFERENDLTATGIERPPDTPDDQDELKKLKGLKSRDMVDDFKSGLTGAVSTSARQQNNVEMAQQQEPLLTGEFEPANDLNGGGIELSRDTPDELKKLKGSKYGDMVDFLKSGWTLLLTSLILEIASAVFDQLGHALVGMVLAFVALLVATADLIHMPRKERMRLLPISHRTSTATFVPWMPAGTIVEYFGLVGAVWQFVYSTVAYAYARQKKDNPIKTTLLPFIFLLCVVISKLIKTEFIDESA